MCILTFSPEVEESEFVLTHNRDESIHRHSAQLKGQKKLPNEQLYFPIDTQSQGTWMAFSDHRRVISILNGARTPYELTLTGEKSRGEVLLDAFLSPTLEEWHKKYSFEGVLPFTLIHFALREVPLLEELIWDGISTTVEVKDWTKPHLWASATLYTQNEREKRVVYFRETLPTAEKIALLHESNAFTYHGHKSDVRTLCTTQICLDMKRDTTSVVYKDLVGGKMSQITSV